MGRKGKKEMKEEKANIILLASILILAIAGLFFPAQNDCCEEEIVFITENLTIKEFLLKDQTDRNEYIDGEYVCLDFSNDVVANASRYGLETHEVYVQWKGYEDAHSIVVFIVNGQFIHADVTQTDDWVCIDFNTSSYKSYNIRTGELTRSETLEWYCINVKQ